MNDFDDILDRCLVNVRGGRETYESCAARYPAQATQLRLLLPLALRFTAVPSAKMSAERRAAIEAWLLKRAGQFPVTANPRPNRLTQLVLRRTWSMLATIVLILGLAGWGVTSASAASLPGDPLYSLKRFTEDVSLSLASASEQPHLQVQMAYHRLDEYTALSARGEFKPDLIGEAATRLASVLNEVEGSGSKPEQAVVEEVLTAVDTRWSTLQSAAAQLPDAKQTEVVTALSSLATNRERALGVLASRFPDSALLHAKGHIPITATPTATLEATATATATVTVTLTSTPTLAPTIEPSATSKPKITPPGLINTPKPKITPPGQVNTPKPKTTPPGQENPPKPEKTPPGKNK